MITDLRRASHVIPITLVVKSPWIHFTSRTITCYDKYKMPVRVMGKLWNLERVRTKRKFGISLDQPPSTTGLIVLVSRLFCGISIDHIGSDTVFGVYQ